MSIAMTVVEYIAGILALKVVKVRLWDYRKRRGNIQGIICPLFSFFWAILSAIYYFLIHPHILSALHWLAENLAFSFCIGFFYGVFVLDLAYSTHFMVKIRAFAAESGIVVLLEEFREDVHEAFRNHRKKPRFFFSMHTGKPLREILEQYRSTHFTSENRSWKRILPQKKKK